jgi:hypothetical protein
MKIALPRFAKLAPAWLLAALALAAPAAAQRLSVSIGAQTRYGALGVTLGAPVCHAPRPAPRVWIPGRYELVCERVYVPGETRKVWVPPVYRDRYELTYAGGVRRRVSVLVSPGYWRTETSPGHYETRSVRVWVPGHWA